MTRFSNFQSKQRLFYGVAGCIFCVSCAPHLVPEFLIRESKADIAIPKELQNHVERIAEAMHVAQPQRIKVFINKGMSSVSAGNTVLPGGAVIGLSRLVLTKNREDVLKCGLTRKGELVDSVYEGNDIATLLLPTANQINFSIAHELAHIQHLDFLMRSMLAPLALVTLYHASCLLPPIIFPSNPAAIIPMVFAVGLLLYSQVHFAICHWQEYRADRRAALCRQSYAEGGMDTMRKRRDLDMLMRPASSRNRLIQGFKTHPPVEGKSVNQSVLKVALLTSDLDRLQRLQDIYFKHQNLT